LSFAAVVPLSSALGMIGCPSSVGSGWLPAVSVCVSGLSAASLSVSVDDGDRISDVEDAAEVSVLVVELSASSPRSDAGAVAGASFLPCCGAPALIPARIAASRCSSMHAEPAQSFFAHTLSKWPIFAKKSVMPLVASASQRSACH
jgi:hypothetical protein